MIEVFALRVTEQEPVPLQPPPLQPPKVAFIAELGVSGGAGIVVLLNVAVCVVQVVSQLIPAGLEVTVPAFAADLVTVKV